MNATSSKSTDLIELTAEIVAAYAGNNQLDRAELPYLIASVMDGLRRAEAGPTAPAEAKPPVPAVAVKKSITDDYIVCLEDGKKFKSLKRHLSTHYGLSPDAYRKKWGLPNDYPMVAPGYAAQRSALAHASGLGQKRKPSPAAAAPVPSPEKPAPKRRAPRKTKQAA